MGRYAARCCSHGCIDWSQFERVLAGSPRSQLERVCTGQTPHVARYRLWLSPLPGQGTATSVVHPLPRPCPGRPLARLFVCSLAHSPACCLFACSLRLPAFPLARLLARPLVSLLASTARLLAGSLVRLLTRPLVRFDCPFSPLPSRQCQNSPSLTRRLAKTQRPG